MTANFDSAWFRQVLGHLPTGVVIVTGLDAEAQPVGVTIGSFVSVSLEPPYVGFFIGKSRSWPDISKGTLFCANVLSDAQTELCWRFAKDPVEGAANRFDGLEWQQSLNGMPILSGILASIDCTVESVSPAGDHRFVLAQVTSLHTTEATRDAMVFYKGEVGGVAIHGI
ncbi:MAG: flavin reductase family protein [Actinobacteria bacterium]|nr:flavin reductase family protein [Actinomycetota bacterium]